MKLHTKETSYKGYTIKIHVHQDEDMGPPWEEHDGHGVVSDWTTRDKAPGELVLSSDRSSKRYYDFAATLVIAKRDGWGLSDEDKAKLAAKLGRKPTAKQILVASVQSDYEHLRGWCNDEWVWCGFTTEIETLEGEEIEGDSCWGFDGEAYMLTEATDCAHCAIDKHIEETAKEKTESFAMSCRDIVTA